MCQFYAKFYANTNDNDENRWKMKSKKGSRNPLKSRKITLDEKG